MSVWRNDRKFKYVFMFLLKKIARCLGMVTHLLLSLFRKIPLEQGTLNSIYILRRFVLNANKTVFVRKRNRCIHSFSDFLSFNLIDLQHKYLTALYRVSLKIGCNSIMIITSIRTSCMILRDFNVLFNSSYNHIHWEISVLKLSLSMGLRVSSGDRRLLSN